MGGTEAPRYVRLSIGGWCTSLPGMTVVPVQHDAEVPIGPVRYAADRPTVGSEKESGIEKGTAVKCAVCTLAVVVLLAPVAACGGDGDEVFSFAEDDLCEWVTADEIAGYFGEIYDWEGSAEVMRRGDAEPDACSWRLTSDDGELVFEVSAGNAAQRRWSGDVTVPAGSVVEYDGEPVLSGGPDDAAVSGHPAVSEGVVVQGAGPDYVVWVPPREEYLYLYEMRESGPGSWLLNGDEARDLALADRLVDELGWLT